MVGTLDKVKNSPDLVMESWMLEMKKVSLSARILYSLIVSLSHKHGFAWPSQRFMADRLGVSHRTINSLIGQLRKAGILKVDNPTPTRSTCRYTPKQLSSANPHPIDSPPKTDFVGVRKGGTQSLRTTDNTDKLEVGIKKKNPLNPPVGEMRKRPSSVDSRLGEFDSCFKAWPLKQNRKGALRIWKRLARNSELPISGKILSTIEDFKNRDDYWKRGKAPSFHRWLRNHRWEDQPHIVSPSSPPAQVPVSLGSPSPNPEIQARGQLVFVRLGIKTGKANKNLDDITHSIIAGYGGFHGLRMLPVREVGFVLSRFVKEYVALTSSQSSSQNETPKNNEKNRERPQRTIPWPEISSSTLQMGRDIAKGVFVQEMQKDTGGLHA